MDYIYMVNEDRLIVSFNADLDHHLADEIRVVIDGIIDERGVKDIVFDFAKISFMDSAGIGLIMGRYKKIRGIGKIAVAGINPSIERILQISGLHKLVSEYGDVNEAVKKLKEIRI